MFQLIDFLTIYKKPWKDLTDAEKKSFNPFMVHRVISMHPDWVDIVNFTQKYYNMPPDVLYTLWLKVLPKNKLYFKYIKKSAKKVDQSLLSILAEYFNISTREMGEYINSLDKKDITKILFGLGYDNKEVKKLTK